MTADLDGPVLVTGASGFIGRHLVRDLVDDGQKVLAFARRAPSDLYRGSLLVKEVRGDITDLRALIRAAEQAASVVHLAGMISLRGTSHAAAFRTNVVGTLNILDAARIAGTRRLVVLGTQSDNKGAYAQTKRQADHLVLGSDVPHVVLRPSLVYGPGAGGVFGAVAALVRRLPVIPLIGGGNYPMAPIFVADVSRAIREALTRKTLRPEYSLSGPTVITFREFVEAVAEAQHIKRRLVSIPYPLVALGIGLAEKLHLPLPVTSDTLQGLVHPTLHDPSEAMQDLGTRPIDLEEGLRRTFR